jgi:hypothetical protein
MSVLNNLGEKMDPVTLVVIAVVASIAAGFGAGWGLHPDAGAKAIEAQTEAISKLNEGNDKLVERVNEVAVEQSKKEMMIADKLTDIPPQCLKELGGDPMSIDCSWAWCVRTGETDKQRCEAGKLTDELIRQSQKQP